MKGHLKLNLQSYTLYNLDVKIFGHPVDLDVKILGHPVHFVFILHIVDDV